MSIQVPADTPVWVNESRCKACDICVSVCPAGVLSMKLRPSSTQGSMVEISNPESCIGCTSCELNCPDFAIHVAERSEFKFAKLTPESKERQAAIKANKYRHLSE